MSRSGRTALVTGAAIGLGQAVTVRLAEDGHDLVLAGQTLAVDGGLAHV